PRDTQGWYLYRAIVPLDFDRLHWWRFRVFQGRAQWFLLCSDDDFAAGTLVFAEDAGLGADLDLRARNLFIGEDTWAFGAVKDMSWPDESGSSEGLAILEHHGPSVIRLLDTDGDGIPDTLGTALVSIDDCPHLRLARSLSFRCEDGEPTWSISCAPMGSDLSWGVGDWTLQLRDLDGDGRADWKNLVQPLPDGRRLGRRE
ncbi:MAG: hypothetical protein KDB53_17090, partial [Planctomycetes bacterium]|nr:hypothetical protein [Planctomycetota bacterium]